MDKFYNKYRIPSTRLQNWNYGSNAPYFVTICTDHRECFFGKITNGKMFLSDIGEFANQFFGEIPHHFPNVHLNVYVVMPNHVHGIIIINKPFYGIPDALIDYHNQTIVKTPNLGVSTIDAGFIDTGLTDIYPIDAGFIDTDLTDIYPIDAGFIDTDLTDIYPIVAGFIDSGPIISGPTNTPKTTELRNNKWKPGILGVIINQYKRICTINARKLNPDFAWQPRFHDHIIRDINSFNRIRN